MNFEILIYFIVLVGAIIGFLFSALNRKRKINDETFANKARFGLKFEKGDIFDLEGYKKMFFYMNILVSLALLLLAIYSYIVLDGELINLTEEQINMVTILASILAVVILLRINIMNAVKERFISRNDNVPKKHHEIGYVLLNIAFVISMIYNLLTL